MEEEFNKYKRAKITLVKLLCQFYSDSYEPEELDRLKVSYSKDDMNTFKKVYCVSHDYNPEALYVWNMLGLNSPIVTLNSMWDFEHQIFEEEFDINNDYHKLYLEYKRTCITLTERHYKSIMDKSLADNLNIKYIKNLDEENGRIVGYNNLCESAGEAVWNLLGIQEDFISRSSFDEIKRETVDELLNINSKTRIR